jgi:hypothetical protein
VPEPDIALHFLIQSLKILNQPLKVFIQHLIRALQATLSEPVFTSRLNGLAGLGEISP